MANTHCPFTPGSWGTQGTVIVEDNTIKTTVAQASTTPALCLYAGDFNNNVYFVANHNKMLGFGRDIQWGGFGGNNPGARVNLDENYESANSAVHSTTAPYDALIEQRKFILSGGDMWSLSTSD